MTIEPLTNFPIIRDLVVDTEAYDRVVFSLHPTISRKNDTPAKFPEIISHDKMMPAYKLMSCLECYVCTAATPVNNLSRDGVDWNNSPGAAALVLFAKASLDPRDALDRRPLAAASGVKDMPLYSELTGICPNEIDILNDAIVPIKRRFWKNAQETVQPNAASRIFVKSSAWSAFVKLTEDGKKKLLAGGALKRVQFREVSEAYAYSTGR